MLGKKFVVTAAAVVAVVAGSFVSIELPRAEAAQVTVPALKYKTRVLKNGLKIYTMQDRSTPNVTVQMWYDVGSKNDPEGRSGFAHLFEHILSRKTRNMPLNLVNQLTEDVGGVRNASTGDDRTNYFEIVPAAYLETMLWTHAERMARPVVDNTVFETERGVVKEELRQRYLAPTYGRFFGFVFAENCYDALPNRRPGIGNIDELNAATLDDARGFHEAFYGPDTATLIVSGNFDQAKLDALIDKYFAEIPKRANPASVVITAKEKPRTAARSVTAYAPNVPLPAIASLWPLPPLTHKDAPALMVLDSILSRGESSRLTKSLVNTSEVASETSTFLEQQEDGGCMGTYAILAGGKSVSDAESAMRAEIVRVRDTQVTAAELAEAKVELLAQDLSERETFSGRAFLLGEALVSTGDPKFWDKTQAAIQAVTAADVQRVARAYMTDNSRVDVRYLDEGQRPAGEADNWKNPVPMPKFAALQKATGTPNEVLPEGQRQAPPAPSADVPVIPPKIAEQTLPNGMRVIAARTSDVPLVALTLVAAGSASTDPAGKAGLANVSTQMMPKGTTTRTADQIAAGLESLGATIEPQAGYDGSSINVTVPAATVDGAAVLLADIARNASFPQTEFERERRRAVDAWALTLKNPGTLSALVAQRAMYGSAPYGSVVGGTDVTLARLTREDAVTAHAAMWRPGNATLVMTGGIDPAQAFALASRVFGDWKAGSGDAPIPTARAGEPQKVRTIVVDLPGAGQAAVTASVRALKRTDPEYYSLLAANAVLGAGSNGRLFQEIRVKRALSYGSYSSLPARYDVAVISASAQTKNESAAEVAKVILDELERLKTEPLPDAAVTKRKTFLAGGFNRQVQTAGGLGGTMGGYVLNGTPSSEVVAYNGKLAQVTPASASAAGARYAGAARATLVIVGDAAKFLDALKAVRSDVEVIPIDQLDLESASLRK